MHEVAAQNELGAVDRNRELGKFSCFTKFLSNKLNEIVLVNVPPACMLLVNEWIP